MIMVSGYSTSSLSVLSRVIRKSLTIRNGYSIFRRPSFALYEQLSSPSNSKSRDQSDCFIATITNLSLHHNNENGIEYVTNRHPDGSTRTSSKHVVHYLAAYNNDTQTTVQDAITSVLLQNSTEEQDICGKTAGSLELQELDDQYRDWDPEYRHDSSSFDIGKGTSKSSSLELLALGSVWFLPASAPRDPSLGTKPQRLDISHAAQQLQGGDYLRIHVNPRRYPHFNNNTSMIVHSNPKKGFMIVNKPCFLPVHATVDNRLENVVSYIGRHQHQQKQKQKLNFTIDSDISLEDDNHYTKLHSDDVYVSTGQRLDQNTSGLLVVSTKPSFAAYFAKLLRQKTNHHLSTFSNDSKNYDYNNNNNNNNTRVKKKYKCLLCCCGEKNEVLSKLKKYTTEPMIHYLQPSIRAPKLFVADPNNITSPLQTKELDKDNVNSLDDTSWLQCSLQIMHSSLNRRNSFDIIPMTIQLQHDLLSSSLGKLYHGMMLPKNCNGVVEVTVELFTGRTHQIRGQFAALGMPLVGDEMYGGIVPSHNNDDSDNEDIPHYLKSPNLALQCCELSFVDPDIIPPIAKSDQENYMYNTKDNKNNKQNKREKKRLKKGSKETAEPSRDPPRWNTFSLNEAWWTSILSKHSAFPHTEISIETSQPNSPSSTTAATMLRNDDTVVTTSKEDELLVNQIKNKINMRMAKTENKDQHIPPDSNREDENKEISFVQLEPGVHKYVLISARLKSTGKKCWFVKSASPQQCGGPYHANVASPLLDELMQSSNNHDNGYENVKVEGGGRIDYNHVDDVDSSCSHAHVFGFSYGFGKGDHARVANIIEKYSNIIATFDMSDDIY